MLLLAVPTAEAGVAPPGLVVTTDGDATQSCAAGAALQEALRLRLPAVRLETSGSAHGDDLVASLTPHPGHWKLTVTKADGAVAVSRDLQAPESGCAELAATAALIVDRYLTDIEWPGRPVSFEPPPPIVQGVSIALGAGGSLGAFGAPSFAANPALSLEVAARLREPWRLGIWLFGELTSSQTSVDVNSARVGSLQTQMGIAAVTGQLCGGRDSFSACGGVVAGVAVVGAWSTGALYQKETRPGVLPAAGLAGHLSYRFPFPVELGLDLSVVGLPIQQEFYVTEAIYLGGGAQTSELVTPALDAVATIRLAWVP